MRRPLPLRWQIVAWFAALSLALYVTAAGLVLVLDTRQAKRAQVDLIDEAVDSLAVYVAGTGRLDYPELRALEAGAPHSPIWFRVLEGGRTLAATPGFPPLPPAGGPPTEEGEAHTLRGGDGALYDLSRRHVDSRTGWQVEAASAVAPLLERQRLLALVLVATGLVVLPLAAGAGWLLARRAVGPIEGLVRAVDALDSENLGQRLAAPGAVPEQQRLVDAFNALLARLQTTVEAMRSFTADASHELRTPVSVLRSGIEVALRRDRGAAEYRTLLAANLQEIVRLQRTVEGLLALARRGGTGAPRQSSPIDLGAVAEAAVESLAALASEKGVEVERRLTPGVVVDGDPDLLRLATANLLDNALRHTAAGSRVTVTVEAAGEEARLEVRDEGPGIAATDRPHVFERFYRGEGAPPQGTGGLGLAVVRWVAEAHGGTARLLPPGEGPGAAFELRLPRRAAG